MSPTGTAKTRTQPLVLATQVAIGFGIFDYFLRLLDTTIYDLNGRHIKIWMIILPVLAVTIVGSLIAMRRGRRKF